MATDNISMGNYGNKLRLFNLTDTTFDTQALLDATIASMELKNVPYQNQLASYQEELDAWSGLKAQFKAFDETVSGLKNITTQDRLVTNSNENVVGVIANNKALETNFSVSVEKLAQSHKVKTTSQNDANTPLNYKGTFTINDQEIEVDENMTLTDIANKINKTKDANVNAVIVGGSMILTSKETGEENQIKFGDSQEMDAAFGGGTILSRLGIYGPDVNGNNVLNEVQAAQDAVFTVDGVEIKSSSNVISDAVEGVTFTLKNESHGAVSKVGISQNDELIKENTQKFVDDFNTIIKYLNSVTGKEAILQGKTIPMQIKNSMAQTLMTNTDSQFKMFEIGISLDGITKNGQITFDATKLAEKLQENPDEVMKLLTGPNSISDFLSKKLNNTFNEADGTLTNTIKGLNTRMQNIEDTIAKNQVRFEKEQETLLKQFSSYEITMNSLNQQMKYMQSQIEAWNNSNKN